MNVYLAFWKGKTVKVEAETSYKAQQVAAEHFMLHRLKRHEITVVLCEHDGAQVTHKATD